ncbi:MAG TPA: transcriptional repressor [Patescibacteria group bacterium]|nr:transcriptional repressor [Patescibacteria group bacterium]
MTEKVGRRMTNQRQIIYNHVKKHSLAHPTAEEIFQGVRKKLPKISFATVYRNLQVLEDHGSIIPLYYTKDHVRYEAILDNHYHFVCLGCDKVENISQEELSELEQQIAKRHKFSVFYHRLFFYGYCRDCQNLK